MPPVSASAGPVAVTGASGYVGSALVANLLEHGYAVRACVRSVDPERVAHLTAAAASAPGRLELFARDMLTPGAYDDVFLGCVAVFHAAATMARDHKGGLAGSGGSPEEVYEGAMVAMRLVLRSVRSSGTVRRLIFTSSFAAIVHPAEEGYGFTEADWADMGRKDGEWEIKTAAYAKSKVDSERLAYETAREDGSFDVVSHCPPQVLGPLRCRAHHEAWQLRVGRLVEGFPHPKAYWNVVDNRDVAEAQRLSAESSACHNGSRFAPVSPDGAGEMFLRELQRRLRGLYPAYDVAGEEGGRDRRTAVCRSKAARDVLGLRPHSIDDTLRATVDSLLALGLIEPRLRRGLTHRAVEAASRRIRSCFEGCAQRTTTPLRPHIILKLNRCRGSRRKGAGASPVSEQWQQVVDVLAERGLCGSAGISGEDLEQADERFVGWCRQLQESGRMEFWNQGYSFQRREVNGKAREEFCDDLEHQRECFHKTQALSRSVLGSPFRAFGAPFNKTSPETAAVLAEDPDCKVWLYGSPQAARAAGFAGVVIQRFAPWELEHPTHSPNSDYFLSTYRGTYINRRPWRRQHLPRYLCLQGHPSSWEAEHLAAFARVLDFLLEQGCRFLTPSGFAALQPAMRHSSPSASLAVAVDQLNVAIVGLGRIGFDFHFRHCRSSSHFQVVAVVDKEEDRRREARRLAPQVIALSDLEELWSSQQAPHVDLVVIATPTHQHEAMTLDAVQHGSDVVLEKPMTTSCASADRMFAAAKMHGRRIFVFQSQRWEAECAAAKDVQSSGLLGPLFTIRRSFNEYRRRHDWQALTAFGGGMLWNYGSHLLDQLLYLVSYPSLAAVDCHLWSVASQGDADDVAKLWCRTTDGVLLDLEINTAAALPEGEGENRKERGVWQLCGKHGTAVLDRDVFRVRYYDPSTAPALELDTDLAAPGRRYYEESRLPWKECTFPVRREKKRAGQLFYDNVREVLWADRDPSRERVEPLLPPAQARELVRVLELCSRRAIGHAPWKGVELPAPAPDVGHAQVAEIGRDEEGGRNSLTAWSRHQWLQAGQWILRRAFEVLPDATWPATMSWPRQSGILYPRSCTHGSQESRAEHFEGLTRTLLIAAPVLNEVEVLAPKQLGEGKSMAVLYRDLLADACTPSSPRYVGPVPAAEGPVQQQVEGGCLVIALWLGKHWLWDPLPDKTKASVLSLLSDLGKRQTKAHNWRFFSVLMLSFLAQQGHDVDTASIRGHLHHLLCWFTGDGYFRDGKHIDYYGAWSFHFYAAIWVHFYGRDAFPREADAFQQACRPFAEKYPFMFARDGRQIAWGRSSSYRCATASALAGLGFLDLPGADVNWGHIRRLCTGNLQAVMRDASVWQHGIPSAGLHGVFPPVLQSYSCAGSTFWMGKIFAACRLPPDHPFWAAPENEGHWARLSPASPTAAATFEGAGLHVVNRLDGSSEIWPGKVRKCDAGLDNDYTRLAYHSDLPWAAPDGEVVPMGLSLHVPVAWGAPLRPKDRRFAGFHGGWWMWQTEAPEMHCCVDVAMRSIATGALVALRPRLACDYTLCLSTYALPECDPKVIPWHGGSLVRGTHGGVVAARLFGTGWSTVTPSIYTLAAWRHPEGLESTCLVCRTSQAGDSSCGYLLVELHYSRTDVEVSPVVEFVQEAPLGVAAPLQVVSLDGQQLDLDFGWCEGRFTD